MERDRATAVLSSALNGASYIHRLALCQWGQDPIVVARTSIARSPRSEKALPGQWSVDEQWDRWLEFFRGAMPLDSRGGSGVLLAVAVMPGAVLVAEMPGAHYFGAVGVLVERVAKEL